MRLLAHALLCGAAPLFFVTPVMAQGAGGAAAAAASNTLETVVVTARKRAESLQDVPVAVVAITQASLENNLANDLTKVAELAPQVYIGRATTGTGAIIGIRGISTASSDSGLDQSVSMSIDNVSLSRGRIVQSAMFDMQQVEILQGPQALFFGKNSPAGVISIRSADPTREFEGFARAGYEFEAKERYVEGGVSGPVSDTFGARLVARYRKMDGWIKNVSVPGPNPFNANAPIPGALQGDIGPREKELTGRLTLLWKPTDDFSAKFKLTIASSRVNGNGAYAEAFCIAPTTVPTFAGQPMPHSDCAANRVKAETALPALYAARYPYGNGGVPYQASDLGLASLTLEKQFDQVSVTSTTGYYDQYHRGAHIGDWSEYSQIFAAERERYQLFNQEIRFNTDFDGPVNLMAGIYFETSDRKWLNAPDLFNALNPNTGDYASTITTSRSKSTSYSAFAQLRWKIAPDLELAGGARYSRDKKRATLVNLVNNPRAPIFATLFPQGVVLRPRYSDDNISPEATLSWKPRPGQMVYAAYKTGYKAGGISNGGLLSTGSTVANLQFGAEKVKGFEAGYKADLLDRTLRLNAVIYRYRYNGLQVTALNSEIFRYTIRNAASSRTTGVTGEVQWLATENLTLSGNIGYNRAKYLSFPNAQCYSGQTAALGCVAGVQNLSGGTLVRAPKLTYTLGGDYRADLGDGWKADLSASATHSSAFQTATDFAPGGHQKAYWRLNVAVHIGPQDDRFRLSLIGRNLTNSYTKVTTFGWSGAGNPNQFAAIFNRPREVVAQFEYKF